MKQRHAAIIAAEAEMIQAIRSADHFLASLFVGAGRYAKAKAATVMAARRAGKALEAETGVSQRHFLYAVSPEGRAVFLTNELVDNLCNIAQQEQNR